MKNEIISYKLELLKLLTMTLCIEKINFVEPDQSGHIVTNCGEQTVEVGDAKEVHKHTRGLITWEQNQLELWFNVERSIAFLYPGSQGRVGSNIHLRLPLHKHYLN